MEMLHFGQLTDKGIHFANLQGEFRGSELVRVRLPEARREWVRHPKESALQFEERVCAELRGYGDAPAT